VERHFLTRDAASADLIGSAYDAMLRRIIHGPDGSEKPIDFQGHDEWRRRS
jgi:hypothetical protein